MLVLLSICAIRLLNLENRLLKVVALVSCAFDSNEPVAKFREPFTNMVFAKFEKHHWQEVVKIGKT